MFKKIFSVILILMVAVVMNNCENASQKEAQETSDNAYNMAEYADFTLTTDISHLSENQKEMLLLLFKAADLTDEIFWLQNVGEKETFLSSIEDPELRQYAKINYGPWDELNNLTPFIEGYGPKPAGAEFYPHDMTKEEFAAYDNEDKTSLYTLIRRDDDGALTTVWYHNAYKERTEKIAALLEEAALLADDAGFENYLNLRAKALRTDDYFESGLT